MMRYALPQMLQLLSRPNPAPRGRILCFPHAGGDPEVFRAWGRVCPSDVELFAFCLPGRGVRMGESPRTQLSALVDDCLTALLPRLTDDLPTAFFGHSMGALLCFETVRACAHRHLPLPSLLVLSSCLPPHRLPEPQPLSTLQGEDLLRETQQRFGNLPQALLTNQYLQRYFLRYYQADLQAFDSYRYHPDETIPLTCPLLAVGGDCDQTVDPSALQAWRGFTRDFTSAIFPGGHFYLEEVQAQRHLLSKVLQGMRWTSVRGEP
jgi:medium-chain acyl-[acyl-carrier-protein] hydrolase